MRANGASASGPDYPHENGTRPLRRMCGSALSCLNYSSQIHDHTTAFQNRSIIIRKRESEEESGSACWDSFCEGPLRSDRRMSLFLTCILSTRRCSPSWHLTQRVIRFRFFALFIADNGVEVLNLDQPVADKHHLSDVRDTVTQE
jgi:hypothetical protein